MNARDLPARANRGFTLLELLVTISIIAVLAGILVPAVKIVRDSAKANTCKSGLRQFGLAAVAYSNDNEGWNPTMFMLKGNEGGFLDTYFEKNQTVNAAGSLLSDASTFGKCPMVRDYYLSGGKTAMGFTGTTAQIAPIYASSAYLLTSQSTAPSTAYCNNVQNMNTMAKTARCAFMYCGDMRWNTGNGVAGGNSSGPQFPHKSNAGFVPSSAWAGRNNAVDGSCNVVYFDGHVGILRLLIPSAAISDYDADSVMVVSTNNPATSAPSDVTGNAKTNWLAFYKGY